MASLSAVVRTVRGEMTGQGLAAEVPAMACEASTTQRPLRAAQSVEAVSSGGDETQLAEHRDAVVQSYLFGDEAVLHLENRGAGKPHRLAGVGGRSEERRVGNEC